MIESYGFAIVFLYRLTCTIELEFAPIAAATPRATAPPYGTGNLPTILCDQLWPLAEKLEMTSTLHGLRRIKNTMSLKGPIADFVDAITELRRRIEEDLQDKRFLFVPADFVPFYGQKELFGPLVAKKFKSAAADIENAGNCLALEQPTACVFHLMRAMEIAVRKLSRRLNVTITPQTTWRQMTGSMDAKIRGMPAATDAQKRKKNKWEEARANLHHVGSVWRNNTMHPATSYTRSQARDVTNAVRVFMSGLCEL
jgi:hypothetical protein